MENQIAVVDLSKCSNSNTDEIKNSETDIISIENKLQYQPHESQNQNQYQQQQQLQLMDKNLCVCVVDVDDDNKKKQHDYINYLESSNIQLLQKTNIIKDLSSAELVLRQQKINTEINLIPITSSSSNDLKQSLKAPLALPNTEKECIQQQQQQVVRNFSDIQTMPVVTPSSSISSSTITTTVSKPISLLTSKLLTSASAPASSKVIVTEKTSIKETTRKESESLQQQNCNDNIILMKNENNNESNTKYEMKENEKSNKNIKFFEHQQQLEIALPIKLTATRRTIKEITEVLPLSAVCTNNENNESKSEYNNNSNNNKYFNLISNDDDKKIDIDVTTISSTDENMIDNLMNVEYKKNANENEQQLTEKSLKKSMNLQRTHSKTESVLEYLNSVEPTVTEIQEKLIDFENNQLSGDGSSIGSTNLLNESESEEDDQLKPLMQDNHTIVVNHEFFVYNNNNNSSNNNNNNNTNNSYSSTDSDLSTQFDQRDLTTLSQNSLDDYNDSGLDTLSIQLKQSSPTTPVLTTKNLKQFKPIPPAPASTPVPIESNTNLDTIQISTQQLLSTSLENREIGELTPMEIPDDKLCEEIVENVEYYFSNENILKDAFLLKHVRRNKEGFVSLKLISSFKRVRQFTKDWRVVGNAIQRKSKKIELNDLGTKIRRLESLPNFDETMPSRTIVVCDLPYEKLSIEKITDIFSKCGEIALVRILKPGMQIPVDVRQFMNKYPEMQQKECSLVEFIDSASARFAKSMQGNYKVFDMVAPKKKTGKKSVTTITKFIENYKYPDTNYERTRGGIENGHHYHSYNHGHNNVNYNNNNNNNQQVVHHNHYNHNHNQVLQNNNSNNCDHEFRSKLRSNYDIRNSAQHLQLQNQESQTQNLIYLPPQQRRYSTSDQENNNRDHIQNMNNLNNQIGNNNNNIHFSHYPPRRMSNSSVNDFQSRKYSSCSEGYSSCSEYSRRPSLTSSGDSSSRKTSSSCTEYCPCSRRTSQCSDIYRKISQTSDIVNSLPNRRFSNGSFHGYEQRQCNNSNDQVILNSHNNTLRRVSFDSNYDRKMSASSINGNKNNNYNNNNNNNNNNVVNNSNNLQQQHQPQQQQQSGQHIVCENHFRKFSNGFDPNRKLSFTDQYFNGRRISTDSGYDRKLSLSSDISSTSTSPRSRANSFILPSQIKPADIHVRSPIGPDGSKGFGSRARKVGQTVQSVN